MSLSQLRKNVKEWSRNRLDVELFNEGGFFMVEPKTASGRGWIAANVQAEPWQWLGGRLAVDQRYAENLVTGMRNDGLKVG